MKRASSLEELSIQQINCHLYRHTFIDPDVFLIGMGDGSPSWVMIHNCSSCNAKREDYCEPETFVLWYRTYDYSNAGGYLLTFRPSVEDLRKELVRRHGLRLVKA